MGETVDRIGTRESARKSINKYLAGPVLSLSFPFGTAALAMRMQQFDKMTPKTEGL